MDKNGHEPSTSSLVKTEEENPPTLDREAIERRDVLRGAGKTLFKAAPLILLLSPSQAYAATAYTPS